MGIDAASGWILGELEDGKEIPPASPISKIHPDKEIGEGFVSLLALDMDTYAAKYGSKSVRKNLTIPAWLNTFAEEEHLNVSKVLQDALTDLYKKKAAMRNSTRPPRAGYFFTWKGSKYFQDSKLHRRHRDRRSEIVQKTVIGPITQRELCRGLCVRFLQDKSGMIQAHCCTRKQKRLA